MKRKLFITLALSLFAVGAVITTNVAQNDISLDDVRVMAMADATEEELPPDDPHGGGSIPGVTITCHQNWQWGRQNKCWIPYVYFGRIHWCDYTGYQQDICDTM